MFPGISDMGLGASPNIALGFDGNVKDLDDASAVVVSALYAKAAGMMPTFFINNNIIAPDPNEKTVHNGTPQTEWMRRSGEFVQSLGFEVYDYSRNPVAASDALSGMIEDGPTLYLMGGPAGTIYQALGGARPGTRDNLGIISHSWANNTGGGFNNGPTITDVLTDYSMVEYKKIFDQNGGDGPRPLGFNSGLWEWMDDVSNPDISAARSIMNSLGGSRLPNDPSDAGMMHYLLTGQERANPLDARDYLLPRLNGITPPPPMEDPPSPPPASEPPLPPVEEDPPSETSYTFRASDLRLGGGYRRETIGGLGAIASMKPVAGRNTGTVTYTHNLPSGRYRVTVDYHDESDGISYMAARKNGRRLGRWKLDEERGSGNTIANGSTRRSRSFELDLTQGDTFSIWARERGLEHARLEAFNLERLS